MRKLLAVLAVLIIGGLVLVRRRARASARDDAPADTKFMLAMHNAFRRDLDQLTRGGRARAVALRGWADFREELEFHRRAEDDDLWPDVRGRLDDPAEIRVVDEMVAQHTRIGPALDAVSDAIAGRGDLEASTNALDQVVREHLDHEEREALPIVERHLSDADWHAFLRTERRKRGSKGAQFLCWVLEDASPADTATVLGELPPPGRVVYRRVLQPRWEARQRWAPETNRVVQPKPHLAST